MSDFDWMLILKWYLISCIPAIFWIVITAWEDIKCHLGYQKPDHKFGLNWEWGKFCLTQYVVVGCLIPVVNLYVGWYLVTCVTCEGIVKCITRWIAKCR